MDSRELKLKLLYLDPVHVYYVSYEEVKELLGTLLICTNIANHLNNILCLSLLIL